MGILSPVRMEQQEKLMARVEGIQEKVVGMEEKQDELPQPQSNPHPPNRNPKHPKHLKIDTGANETEKETEEDVQIAREREETTAEHSQLLREAQMNRKAAVSKLARYKQREEGGRGGGGGAGTVASPRLPYRTLLARARARAMMSDEGYMKSRSLREMALSRAGINR